MRVGASKARDWSLTIVAVDADTDADVEAAYGIENAARDHDAPDIPFRSRYCYAQDLGVPDAGERRVSWLAKLGDRPVGVAHLSLPQLDNLENSWLDVVVDPRYRRYGFGRALFAKAADFARADNRVRIAGGTGRPMPGGVARDDAGAAFARALGAHHALHEIRRRLDVSTVDWTGLDELRADAWTHAAGYSLVQWRDRAPEAHVSGIAYLSSRIVLDVPLGDLTWEPEHIDVSRTRHAERVALARGQRTFTSAAVHDASGAVVAMTALIVRQGTEHYGDQQITLVDPQHRGHRLGLIVKIANLYQALAAEPAIRVIDTFNADVNRHMIAINEAMGFRAVDFEDEWELSL